jgi:hypothetical protein
MMDDGYELRGLQLNRHQAKQLVEFLQRELQL